MKNMNIRLATMVLGLASAMAGRADAAFTLTFSQVGNDVVATGNGSLNLTGLTRLADQATGSSFLRPNEGVALIGSTPDNGLRPLGVYQAFFSPAAGFGTAAPVSTTTDSGGFAGIYTTANVLYVASDYASGSSFGVGATFGGRTFANMGLTAGTYVYRYSATVGGPVVDTFTIQVGPGAVPEPTSLAMLGLGLAGVGLIARMRRV